MLIAVGLSHSPATFFASRLDCYVGRLLGRLGTFFVSDALREKWSALVVDPKRARCLDRLEATLHDLFGSAVGSPSITRLAASIFRHLDSFAGMVLGRLGTFFYWTHLGIRGWHW